jgi:serine/threonine protein kinase
MKDAITNNTTTVHNMPSSVENQKPSPRAKLPPGAIALPGMSVGTQAPKAKAAKLTQAPTNTVHTPRTTPTANSAQPVKTPQRLGVGTKSGGLPPSKLAANPDAILQNHKIPPEFKQAVLYMAKHFGTADAADKNNHKVHLKLQSLVQDAHKAASLPGASQLASAQAADGKITPMADLVSASLAMITDGAARETARTELAKFEKVGAFAAFVPANPISKALIAQAAKRPDFERLLDPNNYTLAQLPKSVRDSAKFGKFMKDLTSALKKGGSSGATAVQKLAPRLGQVLNAKADKSTQFILAASDGKKFVDSLIAEAQKNVGSLGRSAAESTLRKLNETSGWQSSFHHRSLDAEGTSYVAKVENGKRSPEPAKITVDGHDYLLEKKIGEGNFSDVYLYQSKTGDKPDVVVKVPKGENKIEGPLEEARALIAAKGTGTSSVPIMGLTTIIRTQDSTLFVMPLAKFGSGKSAIENIRDNTTLTADEKVNAKLTLFLDLLTAVERLQLATGQLHFDIALRNLLIDETGTALLADFGLTKELKIGENKSKDAAAFVPEKEENMPVKWTSPERLLAASTTAASDIWSLGMTLLSIVRGTDDPYPNVSIKEIFMMVTSFDPNNRTHLPMPKTADWPGAAAAKVHALMTSMLKPNASDRASVSEIIQALKRDFPEVGSSTIRQKMIAALGPKKDPSADEHLYDMT